MKVCGSGDFETEFKKLKAELKLEEIVKYYGSVPLEEIAAEIRGVDLGIIPNKSTTFTHVNFPTRIFEYLCLGKPVIVPRTQGILDYFKEDEIYYFNPGDEEDLARVILQVFNNPDECFEKIKKGFAVYKKLHGLIKNKNW